MERPYRNQDWLEYQYHERGLTRREIGELCGISPTTIRDYMREFGIETREVKGENHGLYGEERSEEVKQQISEELTGREFSEEARQRMAEAHEGESLPEEVREKISDSLAGRPKSEETRRRMRQAKRGTVEDWEYSHWSHRAYNRGFKPAKREVHERDEVCQVCKNDGTSHRLEVHHIIPVRLFRDVDGLDFEDAHCLGNLVLVCGSCHPKVEWGSIKIKPDFSGIPDEHRAAFRYLWESYSDDEPSADDSDN